MDLRVAICDDQVLQVELTKKLLLAVGLARNINFVEAYTGIDLLEKVKNQNLHLIILDVEMNGLSGIDIAEKIREKDEDVLIVFITGFKRYALKAYDLDVFRYIIKPISKDKIFKLMTDVIKHIKRVEAYNEKNSYISFKIKGQIYQVNYNDISYFEKTLRKITVYCRDNNFEFYGSIKELKMQLDDSVFIQIHQGILVNKRMIMKFKDGEITLNGIKDALPVSRRYKNKVINELTDNLFCNNSNVK